MPGSTAVDTPRIGSNIRPLPHPVKGHARGGRPFRGAARESSRKSDVHPVVGRRGNRNAAPIRRDTIRRSQFQDMPLSHALYVGVGGFAGSIRQVSGHQSHANRLGGSFPLGTLLVNVAGCVAIGGLSEAIESLPAATAIRAFLVVGLLGSFTTFSAFGSDTVALFRQAARPRPPSTSSPTSRSPSLACGPVGPPCTWHPRRRQHAIRSTEFCPPRPCSILPRRPPGSLPSRSSPD